MAEKKKSGITETSATAVAGAAATIAFQYIQGGIDNVSEIAVTTFVTMLVPLVLRLVHKQRETN